MDWFPCPVTSLKVFAVARLFRRSIDHAWRRGKIANRP
jgi:hypothetical protein